MTEVTKEAYEAALEVVAQREALLLNEMFDTFTNLKAALTEAREDLENVQAELPNNQLPSNIRALVEQYRGQIQNFLDQSEYMLQNTTGTINQYNPPLSPPPLLP